MTVCDFMVEWLRARKMRHVFTLPGGMISPLLDALYRDGNIELTTMHHEQAVAFAVDGLGRFSARPAIGLATVGPGATNLLTGIASCYFDSVPALFLTGQVQSYLIKGNRPVRQFGFQECDIVAMASPVVKAALRARNGDEAAQMLDQAFVLATQGRPGPVLLELPLDVQGMPVKESRLLERACENGSHVNDRIVEQEPRFNDESLIERLLDTFQKAERPLIIAGGGVRSAGSLEECRSFVRQIKVPMAASIMGLDILPASDPLRLGMIGMFGNRWVNLATAETDAVLVLGSRLDPGTISTDVASWRKGRTIFQVDCDAGEMTRIRGVHSIKADLRDFLQLARSVAGRRIFAERPQWLARLQQLRDSSKDTEELAGCKGINPNVLMRQISAVAEDAAAYVIDAGQHLWWACQSLQPAEKQRLISATGLGSIGFSLPAAIGIAVECKKPVVVIVGDGALQTNIQELQTVVRNKLPIKIIVLNNQCHGSVRQLQEKAFDGRYPSAVWGYDTPDFARVAEAYGIPARTISEPSHVSDALQWVWNDSPSAVLLQVLISPDLNVYPNVPFGRSLTEMESFSHP